MKTLTPRAARALATATKASRTLTLLESQAARARQERDMAIRNAMSQGASYRQTAAAANVSTRMIQLIRADGYNTSTETQPQTIELDIAA